MKADTKTYLINRLSGYWKMEAANMALLPFCMVFVTKGQLSLWTWLAMIATVVLLGIGALYWRIKLHQLQGRGEKFEATMALIRRWQLPSLVLSVIGIGLCGLLWVRPELSAGKGDRLVITFMSVLAVLEYINYYHRQLNYFDNKADLQRVFAGKGFRPSQMRRDLNQLARRD